MRKFGLIGYPLSHSFSKKYFSAKFDREGRSDCVYDLYEIDDIQKLREVLDANPELVGLNVTIPYKLQVIPFLDQLDPACEAIGAVNTIKISQGRLLGYNTDYYGFKASLEGWLGGLRPKALVLGTGGASKAVAEALRDLGISFLFVSRHAEVGNDTVVTYQQLKNQGELVDQYHLIINTTPVGTYPSTELTPEVPFNLVDSRHMLYDLVYNPEMTAIMKAMAARGAKVKNGLEMLHLQAESSWEIWNS
ncbi:Shikimate 5-dehydrogenase I alpha [Lunatimonas lonarensis]|uniref:Shikimate 5-dehydrogenase I alpha n=1 Tax=Lunatimonas lonarensis TaxID=1232681 RepID=R7ZYJ7_9BACT|nr:shikimate dehydrogenase [Lunatimonas lonarensis]EON79134.1 Shikimate 5-dehydrogenase I alpha [Lunatimonas lonarensis]